MKSKRRLKAHLPKSSEHVWLGIAFSFWSLWLTTEVGLICNLFHPERITELIGVGLGSFGAIFAVLAMIDAHKAFLKAEQVEEAIGSFRMTFQEVIEEMVKMIRNAKKQLSILVPTPGFGYLFGERDLSRAFVEELEAFLRRDETMLSLFLVVGDKSRPVKKWIPQRYLRRAFQIEEDGTRRTAKAGIYTELVGRVFRAIIDNPNSAMLTVLRADPNIRLILADVDDPDNRCCFLSFAQSNPDVINREFKSTGFKSSHGHMVQSVQDLLNVYSSELGDRVPLNKIDSMKSLYVIVK